MSIKITVTKDPFIAIRNTLGAIKGVESIVANELQLAIDNVVKEKGFTTVESITDFELEVTQSQLASLKSGFVALADDKIDAISMATLIGVAKIFKIGNTVEKGIRAKLPQPIDDSELDSLVELDA